MRPYHSLLTLTIAVIAGFGLFCCSPDEDEPEIPVVKTKATVETLGFEDLTAYSAVISGEVTDSGNCAIIVKGFCWAKYPQIPWFDSTKYGVSIVEDNINFRETLQLSPGKKYFVRSFVKNEMGTTYGNTIIVTTPGGRPTFDASPTVTHTDSSATITFAVNNSELATEVLIRYGTDTNYGMTVMSESIDSCKAYSITISLYYGTKYYYRVDLKNDVGWNYATGNFQTANPPIPPPLPGPDCVDIDGNVYKSVKIGDQFWITRNFDAEHYNDGTEIPYVASDEDWLKAADESMGARCFYNNDPELRKVYGTLYNGYTVNVNTSKLAPEGWHIPTYREWDYLRGALQIIDPDNYSDSYACREAGTAHWKEPNYGATNISGFTALPGGGRYITASGGILEFTDLTTDAVFWVADDGIATFAYTSYNIVNLHDGQIINRLSGLSIRLVKD